MKRIAALSMFLLLLVGVMMAQPPEGRRGPGGRGGDPEQMLDRQIASMKEAVNLTDDQEKQIRPILADQMKQTRELMANGPSDETREKMGKLQAATKEKISKVLKPEQVAAFDKFMAERRGRGPRGPRPEKQ